MALYDKDKRTADLIGLCDDCGCEVGPENRHWLILWPGQQDLELYCEGCRLELLHSLCDDFWLEGNGAVFKMPWRGREWVMDSVERKLMIDQLDEDECIHEEKSPS